MVLCFCEHRYPRGANHDSEHGSVDAPKMVRPDSRSIAGPTWAEFWVLRFCGADVPERNGVRNVVAKPRLLNDLGHGAQGTDVTDIGFAAIAGQRNSNMRSPCFGEAFDIEVTCVC